MSANPLTPEQIQELKDLQKQIPNVRKQIADAKRAGINVTTAEEELNRSEERVKALLLVYGNMK